MTRAPDIELTERERELLGQIAFNWTSHEQLRASLTPMVALAESLLKRQAIPKIRLLYFTEAERNPGGRGRSREEVFEGNGTSGQEIIAHPHFLPYLEYFIYGPKLPVSVIRAFREAAAVSGYLSSHDIQELTPGAKALVRNVRLDPRDAADEFHKLALEYGARPSTAATLRQSVKTVRIPPHK